MQPMILIKETEYNAKLRCHCSREFWAAKRVNQKCPSCALVWDCTYLKYFKISVQLKKGEDFTTIAMPLHKSASASLLAAMEFAPLLFTTVTGIKIEEIFKVEYDSCDTQKLDTDFVRLCNLHESRGM